MYKTIKQILSSLKEEKDLEKKFFRYAAFYTGVIAAVALFINLLSGLGIVMYILSFLYIILSSFCLYYSNDEKNYKFIRNIFFIGLVTLIDIAYFFNGGLDSSIPSTLIITFFILNLTLKNKKQEYIPFFIISIVNLLILYGIEKTHPELIHPYPTKLDKEIDLIGTYFIISLLIFVTIRFFKSTYESLLKDIEQKNKELILSEHKAIQEKEKAENANNAKKEFLSVMSHEIRTPLNAIVLTSKLLEKANSSERDDLLNTLKYSSENLLALVSDILDFSKIESREIKLEEVSLDLKELVNSIISVHKIRASEQNNILNLEFTNFTNFNFLGDPLRITQVLINLTSNAIKFTKNGEISINIRYISNDPEKDISRIYFEIKDTGIGISKDKQADIFEKFTQENLTITRKYGGTGLGLSITKNLIELMGSKIELESDINLGSKFYFYLDLKNNKPIIENKSDKITKDLSEINILLVEDNKTNILLTKKYFEKWNFKYEIAENGLIALDKFQPNKFDIILMDLQMPEMDGFTATQEIRKIDTKVPIVALTANSMSQEKDKCLSSGFNEYITKPFVPDSLRERIIYFANN
ncbi:MAG: response regulator [Candidatus Sericytochromatia bacterium]